MSFFFALRAQPRNPPSRVSRDDEPENVFFLSHNPNPLRAHRKSRLFCKYGQKFIYFSLPIFKSIGIPIAWFFSHWNPNRLVPCALGSLSPASVHIGIPVARFYTLRIPTRLVLHSSVSHSPGSTLFGFYSLRLPKTSFSVSNSSQIMGSSWVSPLSHWK